MTITETLFLNDLKPVFAIPVLSFPVFYQPTYLYLNNLFIPKGP